MRRLCLFTGGFAAAAGLYLFLLHGAPGVLLAALAAVCALLFLLRRPILRRAAVCVLGLLAGFAWCRGYEALFLRPFADLSGETAAFSAQALAAPQESSYGQSVSARLTLDGKSCMAVIYFDEADGEILPGSLLSGTAKFTTAQEKHLRGKDYDLSRGVFLTASCREALHAEPGRASVWLAPALFAERLRAAIQSAFPSDTAGFVQALLLGDKTGLRYEDQNDLAIAGIYHAVAVSGMHVSILLGMILLLCGGNHRLAAALGLPAAVFFIVMTDAPASAVRAGVMQALVLCAPLVRRENDPPTTICAALLVLLMQNPWSLLSVGLQLSFASTAGIVFFAGGLYRSLSENQFLTRLLRPKTVLSSLLRHADGALLHDLVHGLRAAHYGASIWNCLACRAGRECAGALDALDRFLCRAAHDAACAGPSGGGRRLRMGAELAGAAGAAARAGRGKAPVRGALS